MTCFNRTLAIGHVIAGLGTGAVGLCTGFISLETAFLALEHNLDPVLLYISILSGVVSAKALELSSNSFFNAENRFAKAAEIRFERKGYAF